MKTNVLTRAGMVKLNFMITCVSSCLCHSAMLQSFLKFRFCLWISIRAILEICCSTQLIDGDGTFNVSGLESFMKEVKLAECGLSYAVVSIMGPQSSGMLSVLLNLIVFLPFSS